MKSLKTILGVALSIGGLGTAATVAGVSIADNNRAVVDSAVQAASSVTVYCAIEPATLGSYTLKVNANVGDNNTWLQSTMEFVYDTQTISGVKIFKGTFTERYGGVDALQFQLYNGDTWVSQKQPYSSWTTASTFNGKLFKYKEGTWQNYTETVDQIGLVGSFDGGDWDNDIDLTVNAATHTATYSNDLVLKKNDAFKLRTKGTWTANQWGHSCKVSNSFADSCFTNDNDGNFKALHDCTVSNISLNYETGQVTLTGTQAAQDSEDVHYLHLYTASTNQWTDETLALKQGSTTEWTGQFTFGIGDKFLFDIAGDWYGVSYVKNNTGIYDEYSYIWNDGSGNFFVNVAGTYTVFMEMDPNNFGVWLQKDSVDGAANSKQFAIQFNTAIAAVCDYNGVNTDPEDLQAAWQAQADSFGDQVDEVKNYLKTATASHSDSDVAAFIAKYTKVYTLRGSILASHGGDFLNKGITPTGTNVIGSQINNNSNNGVSIIIIASSVIALTAVGAFFILRKKKHN